MSVFFRKLRINENTGTATIIVTDKLITSKKSELAGMSVATRATGNVTFGILSLIDPETNKVMRANHPTIKALQNKLNQGVGLSQRSVVQQQRGVMPCCLFN